MGKKISVTVYALALIGAGCALAFSPGSAFADECVIKCETCTIDYKTGTATCSNCTITGCTTSPTPVRPSTGG